MNQPLTNLRLKESRRIAEALDRWIETTGPEMRSGAYAAIIRLSGRDEFLSDIMAEALNRGNDIAGVPPVKILDFSSGIDSKGMAEALTDLGAGKRIFVASGEDPDLTAMTELDSAARSLGLSVDAGVLFGPKQVPMDMMVEGETVLVSMKRRRQLAERLREAERTQPIQAAHVRLITSAPMLTEDAFNSIKERLIAHTLTPDALVALHVDKSLRVKQGSPTKQWQSKRGEINGFVNLAYNYHDVLGHIGVSALVDMLEDPKRNYTLQSFDQAEHLLLNNYLRQQKARPTDVLREGEREAKVAESPRPASWPATVRRILGVDEKMLGSGFSIDVFLSAWEKEKPLADSVLSNPKFAEDLSDIRTWIRDRYKYDTTEIPGILPGIRTLLAALRHAVAHDEFGVIIGDDTSGRIPTLLVAKAINGYRKSRGLPPLPVRFIEGVKAAYSPDQIEAFKAFLPMLGSIDKSKRALVVTERVGYGGNVGSILERLYENGFSADVATLGDATVERLASLSKEGYWRPGIRGYSGNGNPGPVLDNTGLSGLRQRGRKCKDSPVVRGDPDVRRKLARARADIARATPSLIAELA